MNPAHVHLVLNHIPLLGVVFGLLLLLTGVIERNDVLKKAALATLAVAALAVGPVFLSGEPAEELVEDLAGVSARAIERHEESAVVSLVATGLLGVVALGGWWLVRRGWPAARHFVVGAFVIGLVAAAFLIQTAAFGGQIRHNELRPGAISVEDHERDDDRRGRR